MIHVQLGQILKLVYNAFTSNKCNIGLCINAILLCNFTKKCIGIVKVGAQSMGAQSERVQSVGMQNIGRKVWGAK